MICLISLLVCAWAGIAAPTRLAALRAATADWPVNILAMIHIVASLSRD